MLGCFQSTMSFSSGGKSGESIDWRYSTYARDQMMAKSKRGKGVRYIYSRPASSQFSPPAMVIQEAIVQSELK